MKQRLADSVRKAKENVASLLSPRWAVEEAVASYRVLRKAIPEVAVGFATPIARRGPAVALVGVAMMAAGAYYLFVAPLLSAEFAIGAALFAVGIALVGLSQYPRIAAPRPAVQRPRPPAPPPPPEEAALARTERLARLTLEMIQMIVLERAMEYFMSRGPSSPPCTHSETHTEAYHYDDELVEKVVCDRCGKVMRVEHYPRKPKSRRKR